MKKGLEARQKVTRERIKKLKSWYADGARWKCLTQCRHCGSDLITSLKEFIEKLESGVYDV